jgi:hypothetical protein
MSLHDLRHYIRVYDDALDPPLCTGMIEAFDSLKNRIPVFSPCSGTRSIAGSSGTTRMSG